MAALGPHSLADAAAKAAPAVVNVTLQGPGQGTFHVSPLTSACTLLLCFGPHFGQVLWTCTNPETKYRLLLDSRPCLQYGLQAAPGVS